MKVINRKTLAKRGGGSGTTSASAGHNTSSMSTGGFKGGKVSARTTGKTPTRSRGGTTRRAHSTYGGGPGLSRIKQRGR